MKCQILFSGKNKKNNIILSSAENAQRVVKVKQLPGICMHDREINLPSVASRICPKLLFFFYLFLFLF